MKGFARSLAKLKDMTIIVGMTSLLTSIWSITGVGVPSFLEGIGYLFGVFGGTGPQYAVRSKPFVDDRAAMRNDWEVVFRDIKTSAQVFKR